MLLALLLLIGAVPIWPHGKGWVMAGSGYDPTVNKHREHLMEKLDIQNTARLTRCAIGADIIEPSVPLTIA